MKIDTFKLEEWMNNYCPMAEYDLTSTCIMPLSTSELFQICGIDNPKKLWSMPLDYGEIHGSLKLKNAIKTLHSNIDINNITITHGAIGANQLVYEALIDKGDDVITIVPIYQQHISIPKALGANVNLITLNENSNWGLNIRDIETKITKKTKLIVLNNPNNPTGGIIKEETLKKIIELAKNYNCWILCDEVYRGLDFNKKFQKSIFDMYEKGISTSSMSKTYSLPGLRVGWVCAREDLIAEINKHREYNTISISPIDEYFSAIAIENKEKILNRNYKIMEKGYSILKEWTNQDIYIKLNMPQGGTTVLARYKKDIPSKKLCKDLLLKTKTAILPGETMDMEGFIRIGYCIKPETLSKGLENLSKYLRTI